MLQCDCVLQWTPQGVLQGTLQGVLHRDSKYIGICVAVCASEVTMQRTLWKPLLHSVVYVAGDSTVCIVS